jgi:hypothetical protein
MGRTLASASVLLMQFKDDMAPLKKGLAKEDRRALEGLYVYANRHVAEAAYAAGQVPSLTFMLAMMLEMHREVMELREKVAGGDHRLNALLKP